MKRGTYSVPEPVGSSGQTNTTGTNGQWEDFTNDNPGTRTPCRCEEEYEDGDECDLGIDGWDVIGAGITSSVNYVGVVETDGDTDNSHEELTDQHAEGTPNEKRTSAESLNSVERNRGGADVDEGED